MSENNPVDALSICPKCNCDGCYIVPINESKFSYFCWGCGYYSNDLMKDFDEDTYEELMPELYKDSKFVDSEGRTWYPTSINKEGKGTVFLNGKTKEEAQWSAIRVIPLTEEEKKQPKYKNMSYKSDAKSLQSFGNDFIEACSYIGLFD